MRILGLALLLIFPCLQAWAATECYGPTPAKAYIIYLHGIDSAEPGPLEQLNRTRLKKIAEDLGVRIALPRSPQPCADGKKLCWNPNADSPENAYAQLKAAQALSKECFPQQGASPHLLGFSSGGFLANKILRYCLDAEFKTVTSVGAASAVSAGDPLDLRSCKPLRMLLSRTEATRNDAEKFMKAMLKRGGRVSMDYFEGNHELPLTETEKILSEQILAAELNSASSALAGLTYQGRNCPP